MSEIKTGYATMPAEWLENYRQSLHKHIQVVREAGERLGVPESQLYIHDESKWTDDEFPFYARQFHGDAGDPDGFARAWLHHIHYNPHHPEHWVLPQRNGFPSGFCENTSNILAETYKFIKTHVALSSVNANSNPLEIADFVASSFGSGNGMVNTGIKTWNQLFFRDSAPIILFFQLVKKNPTELFVIMTAGIPNECSPMEKAVIPTSGERWFSTASTQTSKPTFLTENFIPISVLSLPSNLVFFRDFSVISSSLPGFLMQSSELSQFYVSHFSFISNSESHVVSLALDAMLGSIKLFGKNRGAICVIPTKHDFLFFGCPVSCNSFIHDRFKSPVLNSLFFNVGYCNIEYGWKQYVFPFNTPESTATENGALEMPECYALEMISDWQSSSFCYTGSWDMTDWLEKNSSKIILHSNTAIYVQRVLYDLGYKNIVFTTNKKSVV